MTIFYLYRLKIERPKTLSLFDDPSRAADEIIRSAIEEKPSEELRRGQSWRIGNVQNLSDETMFFALGKITSATHELYDESRGDFVEEAFEEAPHTYIAVDLELQVCSIAQKTKIAPRVDNIARNLSKLLTASRVARDSRLVLTMSEISDPEEFLTLIRNSVRISTFEMTLSPPNPWDVERQFHRPMEEFLQAANAYEGKAGIKGQDLDSSIIEDLARSAASTGNKAKARIQCEGEDRPTLKRLDGNPVIVSVDDIVTDDEKRSLLSRIRDAYCRVRGSDQPI